MKKEQGITLISLVIYIIGMVVLIAITGTLLSFYNNNMVAMNDTSDVNMELSKLEHQMITETKTAGNQITSVTNTTITFSSGNTYSYADNRIYQNAVPMVNYVKEFLSSLETDGEKQILRLYVVISKGESEVVKNLTYVVEGATTITEVGKLEYVLEYDDTTDVYGNLYKISDTEYHLIFNTTGDIAQGYTEVQLVARGTNIKEGAGYVEVTSGVYQSDQPWGEYSKYINKVKIEEKLRPKSIAHYFRDLSQITKIEGIENIETRYVTSMHSTFNGCNNLASLDVSKWDTSNVADMYSMFHLCKNLTSIDVSSWNISKVTTMESMFDGCNNLESLDVSEWNTSQVTTMRAMFINCEDLTSIDVSKWDTSNAINMRSLFNNCKSLTNIDVSKWNTKNVTTMRFMFFSCNDLVQLDVGDWDISNVSDLEEMFNGCNSLTSLNVSKWDTSKVTTMGRLFWNCNSLTSIDVSKWNTSNVTNMQSVFNSCNSLSNIDINGWDTSRVNNMSYMFQGCSKVQKIYVGDKWSTSNVTTSGNMFTACTALSGAISYSSSKIDVTYANYTTGYLTYKAST